jgi:hypothetical protein
MAVPAGRTNRLYGWNAYDWKTDYRYVAAGWTATPTTTAKSATIAITPPVVYPYSQGPILAYMGVLFGPKSGQGYTGKSSMIAAAAAGQVRITDLRSLTAYYLIPIMRTVDGNVIRGPESVMTTL